MPASRTQPTIPDRAQPTALPRLCLTGDHNQRLCLTGDHDHDRFARYVARSSKQSCEPGQTRADNSNKRFAQNSF
jgi:hypothetical protein